MFTRILTSSLLFLIAIGGFVVSYDTGTMRVSESYALGGGPTSPISENEIDRGTTPATTAAAAKETDSSSNWLNEGIQAVNAILGIITVILSPAIIFAGWLLSPDWSSGDLFGLRGPMHKMWIIVSNIVYFIYAILLILIALATIFGKDTFSYKVMLPKLALGILMVPFTWWFVQWTISLSTIVTASVVSIPMETMKDQYHASNDYLNKKIIPGTYTVSSLDKKAGAKSEKTDCKANEAECLSIQDILDHDGGIYNTLLIYAYNVFKIQNYKDIDSPLGKISTAGQLLNNVVISALMILVFGILVMALIAMLMLRAIKLWMYAIFSPVFTLHFVAGKELFGKSTEWFNIKEFIWLCFVPAVVGITLSFWLMVVSIVQIPTQTTAATGDATCTMAKMITLEGNGTTYTGWCTLARLMWSEKNTIRRGILKEWDQTNWETSIITDIVSIAGMNIVFRWLSTNISESVSSANTVNWAFNTAGGIFGTIIIDIIALIFIWMSFMAAKWVSKGIEAAVKPFEEMGNKIGGMATKMPQYMPLPLPGGSVAGATHVLGGAASKLSSKAIDNANESAAGRLFGMDKKADGKAQTATANAVQAINGKDPTGNAIKLALESLKENKWRGKDISEQTAKIAEALKDLTPELRKTVLAHTGIDATALETLMRENDGKKIDKNNLNLSKFENIIVGAAASGTGSTAASGITAIQQGNNASPAFTINLASGIKFDANVTTHAIAWSMLSTDDGKKKVAEFMKTITEDDLKNKKPDNIPPETWNKLIAELKKDWREFKK